MLSIRFLLIIVCLVHLASCMSIRQLYDRAVKREQAVIADSSFGLMQHDDAGTIRHHEPSPPNQIDALKVRGDNTVLPVFGVGRMLRKFAPDYSTEWDE